VGSASGLAGGAMNPARLLAALVAVELWAYSAGAANLPPEDAASHIGEKATVCGVVASAKYEADAQSQPTLLDLGKPSPNAIFTAVVYADNRPKFGTPEASLLGRRICVTGQISDYQGKAEIVLTDPSQLTQ
jgi:hypothetical protein